ncbi:MAG: hypothetical protein HQ523_00610 [Lentisphaerae bacterium]|nr:hypothetical protein [Lentisphaerota bacterium]
MSKLTELEVERTTSQVLVVRVSDTGDFVLGGQSEVEARSIGDPTGQYAGDIEYRRIVSSDYKDTMLLWLVKERFDSDSAFDAWLDAREIPSEFHSVD